MEKSLMLLIILVSLLLNLYYILFRGVLVIGVKREPGRWCFRFNVCNTVGGNLETIWHGKYFFPTLFYGLCASRQHVKDMKALGAKRCRMGKIILDFGEVTEELPI